MTLEETIVAKLRRVPEGQREKVLLLIDEWIEQHRMVYAALDDLIGGAMHALALKTIPLEPDAAT